MCNHRVPPKAGHHDSHTVNAINGTCTAGLTAACRHAQGEQSRTLKATASAKQRMHVTCIKAQSPPRNEHCARGARVFLDVVGHCQDPSTIRTQAGWAWIVHHSNARVYAVHKPSCPLTNLVTLSISLCMSTICMHTTEWQPCVSS